MYKKSLILLFILSTLVVADESIKPNTVAKKSKTSVRDAIAQSGKIKEAQQLDVNRFTKMFKDGSFSGQVRLSHVRDYPETTGSNITQDSALGGQLKYETASLFGVSFAAAFYTSNSLARPSNKDFDNTLTSSNKSYNILAESYVNYGYDGLNVRLGRQQLDTPYVDSDDWRMTPHTFEAYQATYEYKNINFMVANVRNWQGVDTMQDNGSWDGNSWSQTGQNNKGTYFGSVGYADDLIETSLWYYNAGDMTSAWFADAIVAQNINENIGINVGVQYANQFEQDSSGLSANAYGAWTEVTFSSYIPGEIGLNIGYNNSKVDDNKALWGGFGGGPYFVNMEYMTLDAVCVGGDAQAYVGGLVYNLKPFSLLYAYGNFNGFESTGVKARVVEQDFGMSFKFKKQFKLAGIYSSKDDKKNSGRSDWDEDYLHLRLTYTFP